MGFALLSRTSLKNVSTLYWKCLATTTGLRFSIEHLSLYDKASNCSSVIFCPFIFAIIWNNSGHLRSSHDNVMNQVGMPSCWTIATASYIKRCQCGGDPKICLRKKSLTFGIQIFYQALCIIWLQMGCFHSPFMDLSQCDIYTVRHFLLFNHELLCICCKSATKMQ